MNLNAVLINRQFFLTIMNETNYGTAVPKTLKSTALPGAERRYLPRWEVNNRVLCRLDNSMDAVECRSIDLSCSGIGMLIRDQIPLQQKLKLTIYLTEVKALEVEGHVVWQKASSYGNLTGINFENTSLEVQDTLLKYAFEFKKKDLINHWYEGWGGEKAKS